MPVSGELGAALDYSPAAHYDRVLDPWRYLLGDELHYGLFHHGIEPLATATNALTRRMVAASEFSDGMQVLDVGCGSGSPACHLVREQKVSVLGIATSRVSVATAAARAVREGVADRATFEERDGADNGQPDASFDRVWVLESSHLIRRKDRFINECSRVLRPGGRLVLCDLVRRREIPFREVRDRRAEFLVLRSAFGDAHMESIEHYSTFISKAGLILDEVEDLTEATRPTFARWRENAEVHGTVLTELMGRDGLAAFKSACDILEGFWGDGTLGYGLMTAAKAA